MADQMQDRLAASFHTWALYPKVFMTIGYQSRILTHLNSRSELMRARGMSIVQSYQYRSFVVRAVRPVSITAFGSLAERGP